MGWVYSSPLVTLYSTQTEKGKEKNPLLQKGSDYKNIKIH